MKAAMLSVGEVSVLDEGKEWPCSTGWTEAFKTGSVFK